MNDPVTIEVRDSKDNWKTLHDTISRTPLNRKGWKAVNYNGQRFQLFGGIRNPLFINRSHPIKGKVRPEPVPTYLNGV
jgi:hypothetical protein